ncbi:hypothetical protein LCGC14_3099720, partial [marine sediment metagenome]
PEATTRQAGGELVISFWFLVFS